MIDLERLNETFCVEYRKNAINAPLYIAKKDSFEVKPAERCIDFLTAIDLAKEKNLVFSAEGSAFKSSYKVAIALNSFLGKEPFIPRMIYFDCIESGKIIPKDVFKTISEKQLKNWYESLES